MDRGPGGLMGSNPNMDVYSVKRGDPINEATAMTKVWTQVTAGKVKECELAGVFKKIKENKWNHSGAFYSVCFRVDKPILLTEIGFFGPFKDEKATYFVHIELFEPIGTEVMPDCTSRRIGKNKLNVVTEKDEGVFYVDFGRSVPLKSDIWYLIQFMLNGPDTMRCEKTANAVAVEAGDTNVNFEFAKGSHQMPIIRFRLQDDTTPDNSYKSFH